MNPNYYTVVEITEAKTTTTTTTTNMATLVVDKSRDSRMTGGCVYLPKVDLLLK